MKFGSAEDFYIAHAEYVQELEDRAGVPRPCPRCGSDVFIERSFTTTGAVYWVRCDDWKDCSYITMDDKPTQADAWREHEQNCQNADAYAQYCAEEEDEG